MSISALRLGTAWARIAGLMDEAAEAFVRTSFSSVVRDNWDMAVGLMDSAGRQFAQSSRSVPSFVGTMPVTLAAMLRKIPAERLVDGDVLISNDGYLGTGHLNDITMIKPVFDGGRITAWIGSTFHATDIGGAPSVEARDSWEEGLTIPVARILRGGEENEDVFAFLEANLRLPEEVLGDLRAQFAMYDQAAPRLLRILAEEGIADADALSAEIFARSERAMREAIAAVPDGEVFDEVTADGFEHPVTIRLRLEVKGDQLTLDFTGTDAQIARPVNSPLNFSRAYSNYAVKCAFDPTTPNNDGCFRPITLIAPEGSIVNPRRPAPVWGRHLTGHYLPMLVLSALGKLIPDRVVAESGSPLWNVYFTGEHADGRRYVRMFFMNGGHGAAASHDGAACLSFPSNVATQPVEQFENAAPMLITEKSLIPGSGGDGAMRGGLGQRLGFRVIGDKPVTATYRHERVQHPPRGLLGGTAGRGGRDLLNGTQVAAKARLVLQPGDTLVFETPGGGGFGPPADRRAAARDEDAAEGYV
ncbi:hydantoinase B/oxoprolinase family protein [Roseomonas frigidaquae]|uniref:Hydantoinase B/oxoprolinase family protein n=1 Tax=Falsiroseomonas frigidaquae TaxID=487318 RepID=A0ABX1F231_9PROT|nr:hydantoinase B/oxoprolinase family protein [Falsiroseomonas frigidaquae]NKE46392.1 hydantoinase B/oxoprolinase family protein [Falsiroseomonas frigidaquae]